MDLVAIVEPSKGVEPGHMMIGQDSAEGQARFFGFYFDPDTLPVEYQPPKRWQEFLYVNKILGDIRDDSANVQDLRKRKADVICEKRLACDVPIDPLIPPRVDWKHFANYSFSPDDFHSEASPCYNCVTWATMIGNKLVPGFLTPVRQGRIKLILRQLRAEAGKTGEKDG